MTDDTPNDKSEMDKSAPPVTDKGTGQTVMGQTVTNKSGAAEANNTPEDGMASAMTRNRMIKRTYEDPPTDELMGVYAAWADAYDSDLIDGHGYKAPEDAVAGFATLDLAKNARILDAGCGTGLVGLLLHEAGFTHIDGADLSAEMRAIAAKHDVYNRLFQLDMTDDFGIAPADAYDAVISVGGVWLWPAPCAASASHYGGGKTGSPGDDHRQWRRLEGARLGRQLCPASGRTWHRLCAQRADPAYDERWHRSAADRAAALTAPRALRTV